MPSQKPSQLGNLHVTAKAGDCIRIGSSVVHVVRFPSSSQVRLVISAPVTLPVSYGKTFARKLP